MPYFKIISLENFESQYGKIKKGDEINSIQAEDLLEAMTWAYDAYGPFGENIKHKIIKTD